MKAKIYFVAGLMGVLVGCNPAPTTTATPAPAATVKATPSPTVAEWSPKVKAKAEQLMAGRKNGRFETKEFSVKDNGRAWLYLSLTSDDPQVVSGALQGVDRTFLADSDTSTMSKADEKVDEAILKSLNSTDKSVLHYALKTSTDGLGKEPNQEVLAKLIEIAGSHPEVGARVEAINAIASADGYGNNPAVLDVFIKALNDDAPVTSSALFRRNYQMGKSEKAEDLRKVTEGLLKHQDPGVRGRAVIFLQELTSNDADFALKTFEPMTHDKNAFVRSSAATALANSRDLRAADILIKMVDDKEKNTYDIKYTDLLGQVTSVHHDGSAWSRVDDAALQALKQLTYSLGDGKRFQPKDVDYKNVDSDIAANVKSAKAWYEEFKKSNKK